MAEKEELSKVHHGDNMRAARIIKGISQEELAKDLGIFQTQVSRLEGQRRINKETLNKVAKALNISIDFLEGFVPENILGGYSIGDINNTNNDQTTENIFQSDVASIDESTDNSIPETVLKEYIELTEKLHKEITDMRVYMAKNGLDYPPTDSNN